MEYKQMLFDACSSNSEPRLLQLASLKDPEISKSIAQNIFITEAVSQEVFADYPHELLSNPGFIRLGKLNPQFTQDLFARHYQVVPKLILPVTWFRYLLEHASADVRRAAAGNINLPKQFHEHCVNSADTALRMGIASNKNLSYNLLHILRADQDPQIKEIATQNPGNFSLTIKLPTPPTRQATNMLVSDGLNGATPNLFNGNGTVTGFVEPQTAQIQSIDPATVGTITRIQPTQSSALTVVPSRNLMLMVITALSLLCLGLWMALWSTQWGQRTSPSVKSPSPNPSKPSPLLNEAEELANMNQAIEIANAASLAAKKFPDKPGWKSISSQWQKAISLLGKIPPASKLYPTAQAKTRSYRVILETATQNSR
jgi:hypothetical protein